MADVLFIDDCTTEKECNLSPIGEQLYNYCDCLPKHLDCDHFERDLQQLIDLISRETCWAQNPCETFLFSDRREVIDIPEFSRCGCESCVIHFEPFYDLIDVESFEFYIVNMNGIKETEQKIDDEHYSYSDVMQRFNINVCDYIESSRCKCVGEYKLVVKYKAGYSELPDCLLQLFCDMMHIMTLKNACDCKVCQSCRFEDAETETTEHDNLSPKLNEYLNTLLTTAYQRQIQQMSLCYKINTRFWGVVV